MLVGKAAKGSQSSCPGKNKNAKSSAPKLFGLSWGNKWLIHLGFEGIPLVQKLISELLEFSRWKYMRWIEAAWVER